MAWQASEMARQYLASEQGAMRRDWGGQLPIALVYPNSYAVGMSSLAMHSLYRYWNAQPGVVCERAFAWLGRAAGEAGPSPPLLLESQRPLAEAAIIAISVSFEMDYFHVVELLRCAGIPLRADERDDRHPLVLLGGPAVSANPAPLALLADAILIGEAEPALPALTAALVEAAPEGRAALLDALSGIAGLYLPQRHGCQAVQRLCLADLDAWPTSSAIIAPKAEFGDMHLIEIARGCLRGCRFCLAGYLYRPMRERSVESILQQARAGRPLRKIGLVSAAVSDYGAIDELVARLRAEGMTISVSSLRVRPLSPALVQALQDSGARSITLAPEAGSERLRRAISKGVSRDDVLHAAELLAGRFASLKLYYMIGLPGETDADVDEIVTLSAAAQKAFGREVVVNVTPFVPKAHTPFERAAVAPEVDVEERIKRLRGACRAQRLPFRSEAAWQARVQAVLARGDRAVGEELLTQRRPNARHFMREMAAGGVDPERYLQGQPPDVALPWDFISLGGVEASP
jgi:radical SAM superfamily enzyme YgiQ (UPF0313 family)